MTGGVRIAPFQRIAMEMAGQWVQERFMTERLFALYSADGLVPFKELVLCLSVMGEGDLLEQLECTSYVSCRFAPPVSKEQPAVPNGICVAQVTFVRFALPTGCCSSSLLPEWHRGAAKLTLVDSVVPRVSERRGTGKR